MTDTTTTDPAPPAAPYEAEAEISRLRLQHFIAKRNANVMTVLAIVITLQNTGILVLALLKVFSPETKDVLLMVLNGSGVLQGYILNYYFGSSAGSADKSNALAAMAKKP